MATARTTPATFQRSELWLLACHGGADHARAMQLGSADMAWEAPVQLSTLAVAMHMTF
jgi:hypothetical protein